MIEEEEYSPLDESLRNVFGDFDLPPAEHVWGGIEQRLPGPPEPPRPRRRPFPLPLLLPLAFLLGLLGGWLLPRGGATTAVRPSQPASTAAATQTAPFGAAAPRPAAGGSLVDARPATATVTAPLILRQPLSRPAAAQPATQAAPTTSISPTPAVSTTLVAPLPGTVAVLVQPDSVRPAQPLGQTETVLLTAPADTVPGLVRPLVTLTRTNLAYLRDSAADTRPASRQALLVNSLRAEKSELLRLQRRVDSLLLALGAQAPGSPYVATTPAPDTARSRPPLRRWSLLLAATPEQTYQTLRTAATDTLLAMRRNQERGRRGFNATLQAEYRLDNRLSVGAGLGYSRSGTELRVAEQRTDVSVRYDTTTTNTVNVHSSTYTTYSIRLEQIPQLNPIFNPNGQVIGYDTVYIVRPDTVYTTIVQNDTVRTTNRTVTPLIDKRQSTVYRNLQPTYHFFTVPLLLRYRLTLAENTRWWADVALGAQAQLFLGGSQLVTEDGRNYRTERVKVAEGPFRPLNLALSGSIGVNYALTPRLSMSLAPSLRWQALSVYKPTTGLLQRSTATGLQIGARWQF